MTTKNEKVGLPPFAAASNAAPPISGRGLVLLRVQRTMQPNTAIFQTAMAAALPALQPSSWEYQGSAPRRPPNVKLLFHYNNAPGHILLAAMAILYPATSRRPPPPPSSPNPAPLPPAHQLTGERLQPIYLPQVVNYDHPRGSKTPLQQNCIDYSPVCQKIAYLLYLAVIL